MKPRTFIEVEVDDGWFVLEETEIPQLIGEAKVDVVQECKDEAKVEVTQEFKDEAKVDVAKVDVVQEFKGEAKEAKELETLSWSDVVRSMEAKQKPIDCKVQPRFNIPKPNARRVPQVAPSDDFDTPKDWSQTSRARKFGDMGTGSGNTFWNCSYASPRPTSTLEKTVRLVPGMSPADEKAWKAPTRFEIESNMVYPITKRNTSVKFSMDKKKRWEWVEELIKADSDLVLPAKVGHSRPREVGKYEVSSYVLFEPETYYRKERKEDKEMTAYLANLEKNAKVVGSKRQQNVAWNERMARLKKIPEGIDCPRMAFTLKPRTAAPKINLRAARVEMDSSRAFWAPKNLADANDYLDVDMGKTVAVIALGTKGRALQRDAQDEVMEGSPYEWVARFKAFWKRDEREAWKPLGDFTANTDSETEVANFVLDTRTEKPGVELRFLRIQPTGFHGRKCMRIGVYGRNIEGEKEEKEEQKMPNLDMLQCRDVKTSAVVYTVESKLSQEQAGKFNYLRASYPNRRAEKRQVRRANRVEAQRVGKLDGKDAA